MVGPPSAVRAGALAHASTLVSRSNTIAYRQHAHGRGRPTRSASGARDPDWTDTNGRVCLSQIDASWRGAAGHDCPMDRGDRSAGTRHRRFDEYLRYPTDCPSYTSAHN